MSEYPLDQFHKNGFAVIENFFTDSEANELKEAGIQLCVNAPDKNCKVFYAQGSNHLFDDYYFESANKAHYFYENEALDDKGNLIVDKMCAVSKVGHGIHFENPTIKKYAFDKRIQNVAKNLGFKKPAVCQDMYIFKHAKIGGEAKPHQDATYLHTDPVSVVGFWIPTEDATIENGCLWFIKGSHKFGLHNRFKRNPEQTNSGIYENTTPTYPEEDFIPCEVKKGSLVVLHGLIVHKSAPNRSDKSRFVYTFHVIETQDVKYSSDNWLQLPNNQQFPQLCT